MRVLIVGAGLTGCTLANSLAMRGIEVLVVDKREHIAGNVYDELDTCGVMVHRYGPHVFHTNSTKVVDYLSRFTSWRVYEHKVQASVRGMLVPFPINLNTLRQWTGYHSMDGEYAIKYLEYVSTTNKVANSRDVVTNSLGHLLCDDFYAGYTRKQWGRDLQELSPSVASRIPVRTNEDDRYFTDLFQAMPNEGYTMMCRRMLDHRRIRVELGVPPVTAQAQRGFRHDLLIWSGALDAFWSHRLGRLPYRSLRWEYEHYERPWYQATGTVNYPAASVPWTRVTEFKHLTGQKHAGTTIAREFPLDDEEGTEPFYPVPTAESAILADSYRQLAAKEHKVVFAGRLGTYKYLNMDQSVAAALHTADTIAPPKAAVA